MPRTFDSRIASNPTPLLADAMSWPTAAELLLLHPGQYDARFPTMRKSVAYQGLDWYLLRDKWPSPNLCLSIRGGTTEVNHGHLDLFSWQCVAGNETLVHNISQMEYVDSTFGVLRFQIPEMTPQCKNTILINGVGIQKPSTVSSRLLTFQGFPAVQLDGALAFGNIRWGKGLNATKVVRLFVLLSDKAVLILDRIVLPQPGRVETRMHTLARASQTGDIVRIQGKKECLSLAFACTTENIIEVRSPMLTDPGRDCRSIRSITKGLVTDVVMASLLVRGKAALSLVLERKAGKTVVRCKTGKGIPAFNLPFNL